MTLIILGLVFVGLMAIGVPIAFSVGIASVVATLLLPGVDTAARHQGASENEEDDRQERKRVERGQHALHDGGVVDAGQQQGRHY